MLAYPSLPHREAHPPEAHAPPPGDAEAVLAARVERYLAIALGSPPAGRHLSLQLFDLSRLRARLGRRWPELRPRAVAMLEAGLARALGPADLTVDGGGERLFAVRLAGERRDEVARQAELLAAEVTARLCGTVPGGAIIRAVTLPLDPDAALARVTTAVGLRARLSALADGPAADPAGSPIPSGWRPRYRPILHLRKRLVSAYRLTAQAGDGQAPAPGDVPDAEALDGWALGVALGQCAPRREHRPALVVPVHYASLAARRPREALAHHCRRLPPSSSGQLVFEVLDLPPELPQARTRELLGFLRPSCLALLVRLPRVSADLGHLASSGVRGVSVAAGSLPADADARAEALATLAGTARVAGMRSVLVDIASPPWCRAASAAGVDHVSGDALMPTLARPGRAFLVARG